MNFWESSEKVLIREDQQNVIYSWAESFYNVNFACRVVLNSFSVINQWLEGWNIMGKRLSQDYSLCINKDTVLYSTHNKRKSVRQGRSGQKWTIPTKVDVSILIKRSPILDQKIVCIRRDRLLLVKRSSAFDRIDNFDIEVLYESERNNTVHIWRFLIDHVISDCNSR